MAQCAAVTKKKRPCPIEADRIRDGQWFCHVHDPHGLFQEQMEVKRKERRVLTRAKS